jgi:hypothetical protein
MRKIHVLLIILLLAVVSGAQLMAGTAASEKVPQHQYIGVDKCKICHKNQAKGDQYGQWEASSHSKAFATLGSDEAKAVAKAKGIEDPQKAAECLKCHVTGYGAAAELLAPSYKQEDGVGCESCHGAGGDYYKMKTMKALYAKEIEPDSVGLILPDEKVCLGCHNEASPTYKKFVFADRVKMIAHPMPAPTK